MAKVLVLYYSAYGHIEEMAEAVAMGAVRHGVGSRPIGRGRGRAGREGSDQRVGKWI